MRKIVLLSLFISVFSCSDTEELCTLTPSLTTDAPSNLTATSATFLGSIEAPTCSPLTISQGFVYGTNAQPNVNDQFVEVDGEAISTKISGLSPNQTYHCRTYLTNQVGTYYGNEMHFQTAVEVVFSDAVSVADITAFSVVITSGVPGDGSVEITGRGVCWSTSPAPTIAGSKTEEGVGLGLIASDVTGLSAATIYYTRSYATSELETTYGEEQTFTTRDAVVSLTTIPVSAITATTAKSGGTISDDGGAPITVRGLCWSTNPNPTQADDKTEDGSGAGSFSSDLTGLTLGMTYYIRSYATTQVGTTYGEERTFITSLGVGDYTQGGVIFYMAPDQNTDLNGDGSPDQGLLVAIKNQGVVEFGCFGTEVGGLSETRIGTGAQSTTALLNACASAGIAARLCDAYSVTVEGQDYTDWFLPSKDALNEIYQNKNSINSSAIANGGDEFITYFYWSSNEKDRNSAWSHHFSSGNPGQNDKDSRYGVRAVRAF